MCRHIDMCIHILEGTHDFQNVCVSSSSPGEISITGNFIDGSTANSILVIIYSDSRSSYMFSPPSNEEEKLMTRVTGLPSGQYNVSVFVVEENGLPFERSATKPRNVSVREGGESGEQSHTLHCRAIKFREGEHSVYSWSYSCYL